MDFFGELAMSNEIQSRINGEFQGYDDGNVYHLENGAIYQQVGHRYAYRYAYRPLVRVFWHGASLMLEVEGMQAAVPVVHVSCLDEGTIISDFNGFNGQSLFQFQNGHVWQQAEYKYSYHYAYRPDATVVEGVNGPELHVEGMDETVRVRRIR